jgi:hypothetical protein
MMTSPSLHTAVLKCHPETYSEATHGIQAHVCWRGAGELAITYVLTGDIRRLRIPSLRLARSADRLWEHTCFEAFVGLAGKSEYCEFNFSPSGEWAVYAFRRYRESAPLVGKDWAPETTVRSDEKSLELDAMVRLDYLPLIQPRASLRLALSAVIEENSGMISYWALEHPVGKPDFHHPDSFALELQPSDLKGGQAQGLAPTINPRRDETSGE